MLQQQQPGGKRLSFLRRFLKMLELRFQDIPQTIIQEGALKMAFHADDMRLSIVRSIIEHFGYRLRIRLEPSDRRQRKSRRKNADEHYSNLMFLRRFLNSSGMTDAEFADSLGITRDSITYWFKTDDLRISRLYQIAYATKSDLTFWITRAEEPDKMCSPRVTSLVSFYEQYPLDAEMLREC